MTAVPLLTQTHIHIQCTVSSTPAFIWTHEVELVVAAADGAEDTASQGLTLKTSHHVGRASMGAMSPCHPLSRGPGLLPAQAQFLHREEDVQLRGAVTEGMGWARGRRNRPWGTGRSVSPQPSQVEVLTPSISKVTLLGNRIVAGVIS